MNNPTQNFFETQLPALMQTRPNLLGTGAKTIQFSLEGEGGGDWAIDGSKAKPTLVAGRTSSSNCELRCSVSTFSALVEGQLTVRQAFDMAVLKIGGDVGLGMKLGVLFLKPNASAQVGEVRS